jgi:hypothetical protein
MTVAEQMALIPGRHGRTDFSNFSTDRNLLRSSKVSIPVAMGKKITKASVCIVRARSKGRYCPIIKYRKNGLSVDPSMRLIIVVFSAPRTLPPASSVYVIVMLDVGSKEVSARPAKSPGVSWKTADPIPNAAIGTRIKFTRIDEMTTRLSEDLSRTDMLTPIMDG